MHIAAIWHTQDMSEFKENSILARVMVGQALATRWPLQFDHGDFGSHLARG
jgi:hypothetical protein